MSQSQAPWVSFQPRFPRADDSQGTNTRQYHRYQRLGESLRDSLTGRSYKVLLLNRSGVCGYHAATLANTEPCTEPDPQNPSEYVNFHAFAANLYERRIFRADPTWAIWAQREANEIGRKEHGSVRDGYVLAAAQWIS